MHYYKKNIGDYHKKAGRLTMLEHGAYTLLMDACYDREQFPTMEEALDWAWARSEAEEAAVKFVLSKFFTLVDDRYIQNRVKEEVEAYKKMAEQNARIAKDREEKRRSGGAAFTDGSRSVHDSLPIVDDSHLFDHESPPNHKPITNNHEPLEKKEKNAREAVAQQAGPLSAAQQLDEPDYAKIETKGPHKPFEAFKMHADWKPESVSWDSNLKAAFHKVKPEQFTDYTLAEFVFRNKDGQDKTEQKWQQYYINAVAQGMFNKPAHNQPSGNRGYGQPADDKPKPKYDDPSHKPFEPIVDSCERTSPEALAKMMAFFDKEKSHEP